MTGYVIPPNETPEQLQKRKAIAEALMNKPIAQDIGGAIGQGISGLGEAYAYRSQLPQNQFPDAPGGTQPSFFAAMKNMLGGRNNGGPY